jgi:hypothetical protein
MVNEYKKQLKEAVEKFGKQIVDDYCEQVKQQANADLKEGEAINQAGKELLANIDKIIERLEE